jgi:integrase
LESVDSKNKCGRELPLLALPELHAVFVAQRERVSAMERATGQLIPNVFVSPQGKRLVNFRGAWRTACRLAGVPGRLLHDCRRTAVRNLERAGVSRSVAMAITGHKTESIYRRYAIVDSAALSEGVTKLADFHANSQSRVKVGVLPVKFPLKSR